MSPEKVKTWQELSAGELVERLVQFEGPPQEFLRHLLVVQCRLSASEAGVLLRAAGEGQLQVLCVYPALEEGQNPPMWLAQAAEAAAGVLAAGRSAVVPVHAATDLYGTQPERHLVLVPIKHLGRDEVRGASAFLVRSRDPEQLRQARERLELSVSLLSLYEMQLMLQRRRQDMTRLRDALEVTAAVNRHDRFRAAAMGLCNEFATRWSCQRVSLGFVRGRGIRLAAISHTENFSRKMRLVQDLEAAMEECLDQDTEVLHPAGEEATYVSRAAEALSRHHGPSCICALPLRHAGEVRAVLIAERDPQLPFDAATVEAMRLSLDLVAPRLDGLHRQDRWFGAKLAQGLRAGAAKVVGPTHTWVKLLVLAICGLATFLLVGKGDYHVQAPFVFQSVERLVVPAPFDGTLESVQVDLGQRVHKGQLLGRLETIDLEAQRASARAEMNARLKDYDKYRAIPGKMAEAKIAQALAEKARATIELLDHQIRRAELRSPIEGYVVVGDLKRKVFSPVQKGQVLFEVAPVQLLRAELSIDERDVHELHPGREGRLVAASKPGQPVRFVLESINPVAEVEDNRNVFKARARLLESRWWMKPGMKGTARIYIDRRRYAWIWTHRAIDWLRLKLWL